jgi:hypothetical protein
MRLINRLISRIQLNTVLFNYSVDKELDSKVNNLLDSAKRFNLSIELVAKDMYNIHMNIGSTKLSWWTSNRYHAYAHNITIHPKGGKRTYHTGVRVHSDTLLKLINLEKKYA